MLKKIFFFVIVLLLQTNLYAEYQGNKFVFAGLKDTNQSYAVWNEIRPVFENAVNVDCLTSPRVISLNDEELFSSPFLCIDGNIALKFSKQEKQNLKAYILGGGIVLFNNNNKDVTTVFDKSMRELLSEILPNNNLQVINGEHAIYKSFYLVKAVAGLRIIAPYLEGVFIDGDLRVIYSRNDILSVWEKDELGNYSFECVPGDYEQRKEAMKLLLNILVYAITGTYKEDVIHQPYLEQREWLSK